MSSSPQSVPNDSNLVGVVFYTQFAVNDPVNAAKIVLSAGGDGKVAGSNRQVPVAVSEYVLTLW